MRYLPCHSFLQEREKKVIRRILTLCAMKAPDSPTLLGNEDSCIFHQYCPQKKELHGHEAAAPSLDPELPHGT
jgi:hypothetical protein